MRILAIDPGTHCGVAWTDNGTTQAHQVTCLDLSPRRHEGGGMRFLKFRNNLSELCSDSSNVQAIFYEEVAAHKGTAAAHIYGGLVATLQTFCEERNIPYCGVPVGTIKKHATGKGNADKDKMIAAAREKLGYVGSDDNEADALWLLDYAVKDALQGGEA